MAWFIACFASLVECRAVICHMIFRVASNTTGRFEIFKGFFVVRFAIVFVIVIFYLKGKTWQAKKYPDFFVVVLFWEKIFFNKIF